jgi:hypothetical protein
MIKPEHCAREEVFVPAIRVGGIAETRISWVPELMCYVVSVKLRKTGSRLYLATRRTPNEPRRFQRVDVAINVLTKMIGATKFLVTLT